MKKTLILFLCIAINQIYGQIEVTVSTNETGTKIYENGKYVAEDNYTVKIRWNSCANIKFEKVGFLTKTVELCNDKYHTKPSKTYSQPMEKDEAYEASQKDNVANTDIDINTSKKEADAWKQLCIIVNSYFDIPETQDMENGYMRTAWVVQSFNSSTVRTRVIIKQSSIQPLIYKAKICSEISDESGTDVKKDEKFRPWDRVLRKYESLISELQTRLK